MIDGSHHDVAHAREAIVEDAQRPGLATPGGAREHREAAIAEVHLGSTPEGVEPR